MHYIDTSTAVNGRFTNGNPSVPTPATVVDDAWLNTVQAEIANVVLAASITLSKPDDTQLLQAIRTLIAQKGTLAGTVVAFSGTFGGTENKFPIPLGDATPDTSWRLCDGTGGTPDLRGKFILGADASHAAGSTGGAASVTPSITVSAGGGGTSGSAGGGNTGATTLSVSQMPSHNHTVAMGLTECWETSRNIYCPGSGQTLSTSYTGGGQSHTHTIPAHTHTTPAHTHAASCAEVSILPPYYAMAYIIKLAPSA